MFVANRYYNSPYLAQAAGNLGDALFGSPQREYTRAQTEATREATEDRRITRDWVAKQREAIMRMTDAYRAGMGINTGAGEKDLEQAIAAARRVAPQLVPPPRAPTVQAPPPGFVGPLTLEQEAAGTAPPPRGFVGPLTPAQELAAARVPPGVDPEAYANATDWGREVYDASRSGGYDRAWLEDQAIKSGHWPPDPRLAEEQAAAEAEVRARWLAEGLTPPPPGMMAQPSRGSMSVQTQSTRAAPSADGGASLYDVLSAFTDRQPARLAPQEPGAMLADALLAYGPETTMELLGAMQEKRNPYEELGVRALLGDMTGDKDFGRDLALAKMRGDYDLAARRASAGRTGSGGTALDISPTEFEKIRQLVTARLRQGLPDPSDPEGRALIDKDMIDAVVLDAAEIYQQTRNAGVAIDTAISNSKALENLPKKNPYGWWWGIDDYKLPPQGDWVDY